MEEKNLIECFGLFTLLYTSMKNYKNIASTHFVNVNIALNLHSCEKKLQFYTRVHKKDVSFIVL